MSEIRDELWLLSPAGILQPGCAGIPITWFEWDLEENTFYVLRGEGPLGGQDDLDPTLLVEDARFEIHRFLDNEPLPTEGNTQFLLRFWDFGENDQGETTWTFEAYSPEYAMTGRIVDSWASTETTTNPLTTKTGAGDNVEKELVDENIGPGTSLAARKVAELTIDADLSLAYSTTKSCAWDELFAALVDLSDDAATRGKWLSWGMVASGKGTGFTFRTWVGQRGIDHTAGTKDEVIVSKEMGNLRSPRVSFDHRQEVTAVRALGKGESNSRMTVRVEDVERSKASPWAYREAKIESQAETEAGLTTAANAALQRGRPVRGFTGKMIDVDYARYGDRVKYGDMVTALYAGFSFPCRLSKVHGRYSADGEVLDIDLVGSVIL